MALAKKPAASKRVFVYSTLSCPQQYTKWKPTPEGVLAREVEYAVTINGGANVATKNLITPKGVMTEITPRDYEMLLENEHFLAHEDKGFIHVDFSKEEIDEVVDKHMEKKDKSAPVAPGDFPKDVDPKNGVVVPEKKIT